MCGPCDGDYAEIQSSAWVRARKEHKCYACHQTIRKGDDYHIDKQLVDGEFSQYKHCARCWAMCEALWAAGAEYIEYDLNCGEKWEDNFGELPPEIAALAFMTPDEAQKLPRSVPYVVSNVG